MATRKPTSSRPTDFAWFITAPLALLAIVGVTGLAITAPEGEIPHGEWGTALLLCAATVVAGIPVLHVVIRRQALTVTITEVALVLTLHYLPPLTAVLVVVVATLITQLHRRVSSAKIWFNVAKEAAAVSLALLTLAALPSVDGVGPATWAVLSLAVLVNILVALAALVGVHTLLQGWAAGREVLRNSLMGLVNSAINVVVGLVVLIALNTTPWSVVLLAALAIALVILYRSYTHFFRQYRTLGDLYGLTRAMSESGHDGTLADVMLGRVRALMQAEYATLWLPAQGRHPEVLLTAKVDDRGLTDLARTPAEVRERARKKRRTVAVGKRLGGDEFLRQKLRSNGVKDAIVTPLRSGQAVIGTLEVANRLTDVGHFTAADLPVFETVAAHAAVALENSRLVDRLRHDAYHDNLTTLPNRRRVSAALAEAVEVKAPGEMVAVLLFDVNDLQKVNESLGHAAGDKVLAEVATRLRSSAPAGSLVGRVGGDEFVVTLSVPDVDAAVALADRLREQIGHRMVFDTLTLDVDTAAGVAVFPDHGGDPETLLHRVDLAATSAKASHGAIQVFNPALESRTMRRLGLAGDLRRALDNGEVDVYFQPVVTLRDRELVGVECLARWEHPAHGVVAPEDFVAVAEHTGQLGRLTERMLGEALRRSRDWTLTDQPLCVAVNLSGRTLSDPGLPDRVREMLTEYDVPPERLTFEIREAGILDDTAYPLPALRRLRDIGVRLSVDDFGTGRSSLSQLRRLPVNEVKVDRSFVQGMATDPGDLAIVNAVVTLSQQFGLAVVAEGVESELTLELLQDIGCEMGQGFLFSRPLPYERFEAWFTAQPELEHQPGGGAADPRRLRAVH